MGKFFNAGRLISQETRKLTGRRSLAGATAEDMWTGTATARPVPGGIQLSAASTSAEDDGTKTDIWDVTVGGGADAGDIAQITVDGVSYAYRVGTAPTTSTIAEGLKLALTSGSVEVWRITPGGVADAGDTWRVTADGTNYDFVAVGAETVAMLCTGIANAFAGSTTYSAVATATNVTLTALTAGAKTDVTASMVNDANASGTIAATQLVNGVNAPTGLTVTRLANVITISSATVRVISSSYTTDAGVASTCTSVHTQTGGAGTGISAILVEYLDTNGVRRTESVTMNGTTSVAMVATDCKQVLSVTSTAVGSNKGAVGTVTLKNGATVYAQIDAGYNVELAVDTTIPACCLGYIPSVTTAASTASEVEIVSDCNPISGAVVSGAVFHWAMLQASTASETHQPAIAYGPFPNGARVWLRAKGGAARVISACADLYLVSE